jgi:hypothetical protein
VGEVVEQLYLLQDLLVEVVEQAVLEQDVYKYVETQLIH